MLAEKICLKNRLADTYVYYVPFFDLNDAILVMSVTTHNILIYQTKKLTYETVPLSVKPLLRLKC